MFCESKLKGADFVCAGSLSLSLALGKGFRDDRLFKGSAMTKRGAYEALSYMACAAKTERNRTRSKKLSRHSSRRQQSVRLWGRVPAPCPRGQPSPLMAEEDVIAYPVQPSDHKRKLENVESEIQELLRLLPLIQVEERELITTIRKCLVSSKDISVSLILLALITEVNQNILQGLYTRKSEEPYAPVEERLTMEVFLCNKKLKDLSFTAL
ncbi:Uncharacterized protein Rs2_09356 [Raphanus sativus]|nr:Uncharacterized protein Rs2_09356 [Raphanus sativus]